jgi:hypothetical protein
MCVRYDYRTARLIAMVEAKEEPYLGKRDAAWLLNVGWSVGSMQSKFVEASVETSEESSSLFTTWERRFVNNLRRGALPCDSIVPRQQSNAPCGSPLASLVDHLFEF